MFPSAVRGFAAAYLRPQRRRIVLLAVLLLVGIGLQLANPELARRFLDRAQSGAPAAALDRLAIAFLAVAFLTQCASIAETCVAEDVGWRTTNALRVDLTRHVLALDDSFHDHHGAGELIERIDGDVSAIAGFFGRFVVHVVGSGLFLLGVLALLWQADWRVGALLTVFSAAAIAFMTKGGGFVGVHAREARRSSADFSAFLEERLAGLPDIKANGADGYTMQRLHLHIGDRVATARRSILASSLFANIVNVVFVAGAGASLALCIVLFRSGALTLGGVFLVLRYTTMLRVPLERLSRHMNSFQQALGGIVRVQELLAMQPQVTDPPAGTAVPVPEGALAVAFSDVTFAYGEGAVPVLDGVDWALEPGEVVGVLGRTGSGKTTMARLLFRLHDVAAGSVRVGGVDVRDVRLADLRGRVALVTQDVHLFAGTVRDNVTLFDPTVDDARLGAVFDTLGLGPWLASLPDGFATDLGPSGRGVSAGEAQLIALARVFLADPGVVVLDEASSRLDPETERLLETAVGRLLAGRTGIVIAHRLRTVERADRILVLDRGGVAEWGRRADLAADPDSAYAQLVRAGMGEVLA